MLTDFTGGNARGRRLASWDAEGADPRKVVNTMVAGCYHWLIRRTA